MGKYHPHGDQAVYDAMLRLTQKFSISLPIIDGQANIFKDAKYGVVGEWQEVLPAFIEEIKNLL